MGGGVLNQCKTDNAQLQGKLQAMEGQCEALQKGKEEVRQTVGHGGGGGTEPV